MIDMITERYWKGDQSLNAEFVVKRVDGHRFKASVKRDAYDAQSHVKAFVWSERGWEQVASKPIAFAHVKRHTYVSRDDDEWKIDARKDMDAIYEEASEIVPMNWGKRR